MKKLIILLTMASAAFGFSQTLDVTINAGTTIAACKRANLLGINIASYNSPADFSNAVNGVLGDIKVGLIRMPGGSFSDKYYWNGNGVVSNGKIDQSKYSNNFWKVDYSGYHSGFSIDALERSKASPDMAMDTLTMHKITRQHPDARNMVTVNAGTGTPEMAAEWVRWANIKNNFGVKYWEIGNELNGGWEAGHIRPDGSEMTAEKYVEIFVAYAKAMKAVDPTIKIGGPSCDISHHEDYFEPLLRIAGEHVDFLTLHFYSLRSSLAPEAKLFDGLASLKPATDKIKSLVHKYQPQRENEIEISITEWNSKLPKDKDAYRLFNGLWFSAWIGEMMKNGVSSATVWDMFSGADNGHGLLVKKGNDYVPTGRYWGFWLWSRYMADTLIESDITANEDVHVYATRSKDRLYIMLMNESRTATHKLKLNVKDMEIAPAGKLVTLSSREYFFNTYKGEADWNYGPKVRPCPTGNRINMSIPPYSVRIVCLTDAKAPQPKASQKTAKAPGSPELRLLLPESGFGDMEAEGWIRAFRKGSETPYSRQLGTVHLSVDGGAVLSTNELPLTTAASRFKLMPKGPGEVTVTAEINGLKTTQTISFLPVKFEESVIWKFDKDTMPEKSKTQYSSSITKDSIEKRKSLQIQFKEERVKPPKNHIFAIEKIPHKFPKERIGGAVFDILVPDGPGFDDPTATLQVVLQSTGAYWIPCGQISLNEDRGKWRSIQLELPDKKFLQVMDRTFSIRFIMSTKKPVTGNIHLDNMRFMLRPSN